MQKKLSDSELVVIIQETDDKSAFDLLFERHHIRLLKFIALRANSSDADDILQETYLKAFLNIKKFNLTSSFSTWLFSIAVNEFKQLYRRSSKFEWLKSTLNLTHSTEVIAPQNDLLIDFQRRAERLNSSQYEVFILHTFLGLSHSEIVAETGKPLGSVKTYLLQAEKALKVDD